MDDPLPDVTGLLQQWNAGDSRALDKLFPLIYAELRTVAENQLRRERQGHTLQATALVHDLYLRLVEQRGGQWKDRQHFFAFAALVMRRILTDYAKRTRSEKRGGNLERIPLSDDLLWLGNSSREILDFDRALDVLEQTDARKARVVELRVLLGCTAQETAEILSISKVTADRDWTVAKAWLYQQCIGDPGQ